MEGMDKHSVNSYTIWSMASGACLGTYEAHSEWEALDKCAREAGYYGGQAQVELAGLGSRVELNDRQTV